MAINGETSLHDGQPNPELFSFHSCMTDTRKKLPFWGILPVHLGSY